MRSFQRLAFVFTFIFYTIVGNGQSNAPGKGIYDGKIGEEQLILVTDKSDPLLVKGFFVKNKGKALEDTHVFSLMLSGKKPIFQSDLYVGKIKSAKVNQEGIEGRLVLLNGKRRFLFWHPKVDLRFLRRQEIQVNPTMRYQEEIFPEVVVKSDLLYGKAKGYWTNSPYSDEPYITTLSKGLIKSFDEPKLLDLKLDVYYPKTDIFKNRPLVMLIHGGAFYIGAKESACEKSLATALAKRGYLVASIDYRLGFKLTPADIELGAYRAIQDANAALRFLAHNAKGLGIDPDQVYLGGTSAGAVASLNTAFMKNDERPLRILEAEKKRLVGKIEESGNMYTEPFKIKAVVNMWGAVSDLNIIDPDEKISVLSIHGTADDIVPYENDYPFRNSLLINRLIVDKMYGSKPIHDRLQALNFRNKLVSLPGLGHEPELETYNTLNHWMDTIVSNVSRFLYEETAADIVLPPAQLNISAQSVVKPFYFEVNNGSLVQITANGGVKLNNDPLDSQVIWFKDAEKRELVFLTRNKFEAWNKKAFEVKTTQ